MFGIQDGGKGLVTATNIRWKLSDYPSDCATPLFYGGKVYVLDGDRQTFAPHAGHLVEVSGTFSTKAEGGTSNKTVVNHIRVASLKMLAATCPNPKSPAR